MKTAEKKELLQRIEGTKINLKNAYMVTKAIKSTQEKTDMQTKDLQMNTSKLMQERIMIQKQR